MGRMRSCQDRGREMVGTERLGASEPACSPTPTGGASAASAVETSAATLRADQAAWLAQVMSADDDCADQRAAGASRSTIDGDGASGDCARSESAPPAIRSEPVTTRTLGLAPYNRQLRGHPMRRAASVPRRVSERLKKPPVGYPPTMAQSRQLPPGRPPMLDTAAKKLPANYPPTPSPSSTASSPPASPIPRPSPQSKATRGTPANQPSPFGLTASTSARRLSPCNLPPSVALAASASAPAVSTTPASAPRTPTPLASQATAPGAATLARPASRTCVRPPAGLPPPVLSHSLVTAQQLQSLPSPRQLGTTTPVLRPTPRNDGPLPPAAQPQLRTLRLTSGVPIVAPHQLQLRGRPQAGGGTTPPTLQGPPLSMPGWPQQAKAASAPQMNATQPPNAMPLALARARSASAARARSADAASCMARGAVAAVSSTPSHQPPTSTPGMKAGGAAPMAALPLLWLPTTPATARLARQEHWRRCEACGGAVAHRRRDGSAQCPSCGHTFRFALAPPLLPANSLSQLLQEARWRLEEAAKAARQQPDTAGSVGGDGGGVPARARRGKFTRFRRKRRGAKPGGASNRKGGSGDGTSSVSNGRLPCTMSAYLKLKLVAPFYAVQHGAPPPPVEVELWT